MAREAQRPAEMRLRVTGHAAHLLPEGADGFVVLAKTGESPTQGCVHHGTARIKFDVGVRLHNRFLEAPHIDEQIRQENAAVEC